MKREKRAPAAQPASNRPSSRDSGARGEPVGTWISPPRPFKPQKWAYKILWIVLVLWIAALIWMYIKTIYPVRLGAPIS